MVLVVPALIHQARGLVALIGNLLPRIKALWNAHAEAVAGRALAIVGGAVQIVGAFFATLVVTIFMLVFGRDAVSRFLAEAAPDRRPRYERLLHDAYTSLGGYLAGLSLLILSNSAVMSIFLACLRVPYFLPLGVFSGVSVAIPNVGALAAGIALVTVAFVSGGLWKGVATLSFFAVYKIIEGDVLQPAVFRKTVNLNPLATLLAVLFMTELSGVLGAFLAVPLLAVIQVVLRELLSVRRHQRAAQRS